MDAILKTEDLTKRYGKARGIEALSISVAEGEFFGFIGPNGAGKSTTIRALLGLISPTAGRAELFGLDCVKRRKQILAQVGYLPSEAAFYPGMRAGEVIAFPQSCAVWTVHRRLLRFANALHLTRAGRWKSSRLATAKSWASSARCSTSPAFPSLMNRRAALTR